VAHRAAELAFGSDTGVKIAIVSPYALDRPGGVQEQARGLQRHLTAAGHVVTLIGPGVSDGSWTSVGGTTDVEANDAVAPVCFDPGAVAKVKEAVGRADVVHVHEPLVPVIGPAAWIGEDVPSVGTFHAEPGTIVRGIYRFGGPLLGHLLGRMDALTAVSREAATAVRRFAPDVEIVPNGVDMSGYAGNGHRVPHRVAFLGRDDRRKGLDVLLEAWPSVCAKVPDAELVVIGASRPIDESGVVFEGLVLEARKQELLTSASVFCSPNIGNESFGITLLEGMAAGCAVVASDLPAFTAVAAGTAIHVPAGDVDGLTSALVGLLTDQVTVREMGAAARARARAFDWSRLIPRWVSLYARAIEHAGS
jgi:phosphatidylinositol alpha-mannosyltransferase